MKSNCLFIQNNEKFIEKLRVSIKICYNENNTIICNFFKITIGGEDTSGQTKHTLKKETIKIHSIK